MSECLAVLDSSAVLALLQREPGIEVVAPLVGCAAWSAVNMYEVAGKLTDGGMPAPAVRETVGGLNLTVHSFGSDDGYIVAELRRSLSSSLGLGDRACLALAIRLELPAVTADKEWARLSLPGLVVKLIR